MILIFKRVVNGVTEMCGVEVDTPVSTEDGWQLVSSCDSFELKLRDAPVVNETAAEDVKTTATASETKNNIPQVPIGAAYESSVKGTARLTHLKDRIIISWRKGNKSLNTNSPNSVCINDYAKQEFFRDVRATHYGSDWAIAEGERYFTKWLKFIDEEYEAGRVQTNLRLCAAAANN